MKDIAIIGAGIVGLASAFKIKERFPDCKITILEKEASVAQHQTGHNSGVIHSGIYYKPGSLKAQNCFRGHQLMVEFCQQNGIAFDLCGKLIAATEPEEIAKLEGLKARGEENGLSGLRLLSAEEAKEHEPHLRCLSALHVPQAGIVDYKKVSEKLYELLLSQGVEFHFAQKVLSIESQNEVSIHTDREVFTTKHFINCAGLFSDRIARSKALRIIPFRGEYYKLVTGKESLVKNLIYPVPDARLPFLGVHLTRMMGGGIEAGPNAVLALAREGYSWSDVSLRDTLQTLSWPGFYKLANRYFSTGVDEVLRSLSKRRFVESLQKFIPELEESDIEPFGSGVRAQACDRQGRLVDDFVFEETRGGLHVLNAPSPAATSCLAIGERVAEKVRI